MDETDIKRILVADTYDAMTSERPYRKEMSAEAACAEIERCQGTQLDPKVVDAFLRVVNRESKSLGDYQIGRELRIMETAEVLEWK